MAMNAFGYGVYSLTVPWTLPLLPYHFKMCRSLFILEFEAVCPFLIDSFKHILQVSSTLAWSSATEQMLSWIESHGGHLSDLWLLHQEKSTVTFLWFNLPWMTTSICLLPKWLSPRGSPCHSVSQYCPWCPEMVVIVSLCVAPDASQQINKRTLMEFTHSKIITCSESCRTTEKSSMW